MANIIDIGQNTTCDNLGGVVKAYATAFSNVTAVTVGSSGEISGLTMEGSGQWAKLEFDDEALVAIAQKAIERKTGARGLRAILEEVMRDIMYDIPSSENIEKCIVTKDTIKNNEQPQVIINGNVQPLVTKKEKEQVLGSFVILLPILYTKK